MTSAAANLLYVVTNGRIIGDIQVTGTRRMRLRYADKPNRSFTPLSVSMPGPTGRYRETTLVPWLEGLLPDRPETLRQWRRRFHITDETNPFPLLRHIGEDVAGAAQFVRPDRLEFVQQGQGTTVARDDTEIAEMLRRAKADLPVSPTGEDGMFSLAGAQAKIALHKTENEWTDPLGAVPSTHIVKPAIPGMADQDLAEVVTMRTAARLGLRVARCWIAEFEDERAIVVERYDRFQRPDALWRRVHQEDMCQALGVWSGRKYESQGGPNAATIAQLIRRTSQRPEEDNRRFAQALVFNWLVCGTDAHARNYSLLLSGSSVRLAPLYDLNSHLAYTSGSGNDLSMSVNGTFRAAAVTADHWMRDAAALHVDADWLHDEVGRQADGLPAAMTLAAKDNDVARYGSAAISRLLSNTERWLSERC